MKIGFVLDDTLDKPDGVQQYALTLGGWLSSQGHEVHYIVGQTTRTDIPNVHSVARNLPVKFNGNKLTIPLPTSKRRLRELLNSLELDVVHVQMPYSPFMAARVIQVTPTTTAVVGTFHILPFSRLERAATHALGVWLRSTLKRFDAIYAVSDAARAFAESSFHVHAKVLPNVVDVAAFRTKPTQRSGKLVIAFLGRLVPRKGSLELLKALAMLPENIRESLIVRLAGKGALDAELKAFVQSHQLKNIVEFSGFISEADKPAFLEAADIAVFPSLGGESFGIVLIEAMAAGSGVVMGGDNLGYRSVIGEWPEIIVDPHDIQHFAEKLQTMIEFPDYRKDVHAKQQAAVMAYDVNVVGAQWLTVYEQGLRARRNVQ